MKTHSQVFERVWPREEPIAGFEINPFDGAIRLSCIRSFERGKGYGSRALDWLCQLADAHGVTIKGHISPCGMVKPRLNKTQLRQWYKRHGFSVTERSSIVRVPK
jgi:GNAT superfamily N-acetyltransferase